MLRGRGNPSRRGRFHRRRYVHGISLSRTLRDPHQRPRPPDQPAAGRPRGDGMRRSDAGSAARIRLRDGISRTEGACGDRRDLFGMLLYRRFRRDRRRERHLRRWRRGGYRLIRRRREGAADSRVRHAPGTVIPPYRRVSDKGGETQDRPLQRHTGRRRRACPQASRFAPCAEQPPP